MNYIPIDNKNPYYTVDVDIDGYVYEFGLRYNTLADRWSLSLRKKDGDFIFQGLFVVLGFDYFQAVTHQDIPKGRKLFAVNTVANDEPNFDNFGNEVKLVLI